MDKDSYVATLLAKRRKMEYINNPFVFNGFVSWLWKKILCHRVHLFDEVLTESEASYFVCDACGYIANFRPALLDALQAILAEPYGCSLCDSGTPRNPAKGHQPDCPYEVARLAIEKISRESHITQRAPDGVVCPACKSTNAFEAVICVNCGAHSAPRR
jgi:hypothetical protein